MGAEWELSDSRIAPNGDGTKRVNAQGGNTSTPFLSSLGASTYTSSDELIASDGASKSSGIFAASSTPKAHNGLCYFIPVALVSRRVMSAYHPVFAPQGAGLFSDGNHWYNTVDVVNGLSDCL